MPDSHQMDAHKLRTPALSESKPAAIVENVSWLQIGSEITHSLGLHFPTLIG